jgi:ribonuclease HII
MWRNSLGELSTVQIKAHAKNHVADMDLAQLLLNDSRKSVQTLGTSMLRKLAQKQQLIEKFERMNFFENEARHYGFQMIAGIDEVGRGPLAGPVVAAAVILKPGVRILGLDDSKKLSEKQRDQLYLEIQENALAIGVGQVENERIDEINILNASKEAMLKAVAVMDRTPDCLLIDAVELATEIPQKSMVRGDQLSNSIAAASIIAKVERDRMMVLYDQTYPGYDFCHNKGYGTKKHYSGLESEGLTPIHRKTFLKGW